MKIPSQNRLYIAKILQLQWVYINLFYCLENANLIYRSSYFGKQSIYFPECETIKKTGENESETGGQEMPLQNAAAPPPRSGFQKQKVWSLRP